MPFKTLVAPPAATEPFLLPSSTLKNEDGLPVTTPMIFVHVLKKRIKKLINKIKTLILVP
ncbi:MAG TPA: hypothetical protein ENJ95_19275 [Bacteroidetes bacterium]|nr:hypothetical protein [Bacteroidota bacterium]